MKILMMGTVAAGIMSASAAGEAIQWSQADGGNGHWYEVLEFDPPMEWEALLAMTQEGPGHLIVCPEYEERAWCRSTFYEGLGYGETFAIGLYQDLDDPDYSEPGGGWVWVDGTPQDGGFWCVGEPDDGGGQHCAHGFYAAPNACISTGFCEPSAQALIEYDADCNGDGIVDFGQILDGSLEDANANGVPDVCEGIHVPADYASIQDAIDASPSGGTVIIAPGSYNQTILIDKAITVRSSGDTSIDLSDLGSGAVAITGSGDEGVHFQGLTFTGGNAPGDGTCAISTGTPDGVDCHVSFDECRFVDNTGGFGGALQCHPNSVVTVSHSLFSNNWATGHAGAIRVDGANLTCQDTWFIGNGTGHDGGAIEAGEWDVTSLVTATRCGFIANTAGVVQGQITMTYGGDHLTVSDCWFGEFGTAIVNRGLGGGDTTIDVSATYFCDGGISGDWVDQGDNTFDEQCAEGADCDGDGVRDDAAIWTGLVSDENSNGVPDDCDPPATNAIQWSQADGGNGHWYEVLEFDPPMEWEALLAMTQEGPGHLIVCPEYEERAWCRSTFYEGLGYGETFAIGLYQDLDDPDYSEPGGGWVWVDGTPQDGGFWCVGEPDDGGGQHCAHGFYAAPNACISTGFCEPSAQALIEYDADCNGDGIVDFGQILDGSLEDADGNGVPDVCICHADVDESGDVGIDDMLFILAAWGTPNSVADLDGDGVVAIGDILMLLESWGDCS